MRAVAVVGVAVGAAAISGVIEGLGSAGAGAVAGLAATGAFAGAAATDCAATLRDFAAGAIGLVGFCGSCSATGSNRSAINESAFTLAGIIMCKS